MPLCGMHDDTFEHRLWQCEATERLRQDILGDRILGQLAADRDAKLLKQGVMRHPGTWIRGPPTQGCCTERTVLIGPRPQELDNGRTIIFVDGSCIHPAGVPGLARAAWSAVICREGSDQAKVCSGPVWQPLPQTSAAAEWVALAAAVQYTDGDDQYVVYSDYENVCRKGLRNWDQAAEAGSVYAGVRRDAAGHPGAARIDAVLKAKAHQDLQGLSPGTAEHYLAVGNAMADQAAKDKAAEQDRQEQWRVTEASQQRSLLDKVIRYVGEALVLWPKLQGKLVKAAKEDDSEAAPHRHAKARRPRRPEDGGHSWHFHNDFWRCRVCLTFCSARRAHERAAEKCPGPRADLMELVRSPKGHRLLTGEYGDSFVVVCSACGAYATRMLRQLADPCGGFMTAARARDWNHICGGRHPKRGTVGPLVPLRLGTDFAEGAPTTQ